MEASQVIGQVPLEKVRGPWPLTVFHSSLEIKWSGFCVKRELRSVSSFPGQECWEIEPGERRTHNPTERVRRCHSHQESGQGGQSLLSSWVTWAIQALKLDFFSVGKSLSDVSAQKQEVREVLCVKTVPTPSRGLLGQPPLPGEEAPVSSGVFLKL